MKIYAETKTGGVENAVFANPLLIGGFSQSSEMTVLPVVVAIITQLPLRVEIEIIPEPAIETELYAADVYRIPEHTHAGFEHKSSPPQRQWFGMRGGHLLVFGWDISIERDNISM